MNVSTQIETSEKTEEENTVGKLCWHVHHNILAEFLTEPLQVRVDYIKHNKPAEQVKRRLELMKIADPQPDWAVDAKAKLDKAYAQLAEAQDALADAQKNNNDAWETLDNVWEELDYLQARLDKLRTLRDEAEAKWDKARDEFKASSWNNVGAARARWNEATRELDAAENRYIVTTEELKEVRAKRAEAEAKRKNTEAILGKAYAEWGEAQDALKAAWDEAAELLRKHAAELEKLHEEQCPQCPWDGETIFSDEE